MNYTIEKTIMGVEVEVEFDYTPGHKSRDPYQPDDSAEVDVISILIGGQDITNIINDHFREMVEDVCYSEGYDLMCDDEDTARAERAEYYAEMED